MNRQAAWAVLVLATALGCGTQDGPTTVLVSGEQEPTMPIRQFNPLHCSGKNAGRKNCLV